MSYHDLQPLTKDMLNSAELVIEAGVHGIEDRVYRGLESGVITVKLDIPDSMNSEMRVRARYYDHYGQSAETDILGFPAHSMRNQYIHIFSSTQLGSIGEFAIFHVRSNFYMESFHYMVRNPVMK